MDSGITILVVDDEEAICTLMQKLLQRKGYNVLTAPDGDKALEMLGSNNITAVISDIVMPAMGGKDLLTSIKEKFPQIAVIMMTGYGDAFTIKQVMALGADEYITKPFKGDEVLMIVERVLWRLSNPTASPAPLAD